MFYFFFVSCFFFNAPATTEIYTLSLHDAVPISLRSGAFPPAAPGAGFPGADAQGPIPLDFKKLPPFEAIEKYLFSSGSYIIPDKNGAVFVGFSPKKATGSK